ncbi:MAG TPA: hypothetical protein VIQ22_00030 [Gammaproteobacteria bacterium]
MSRMACTRGLVMHGSRPTLPLLLRYGNQQQHRSFSAEVTPAHPSPPISDWQL